MITNQRYTEKITTGLTVVQIIGSNPFASTKKIKHLQIKCKCFFVYPIKHVGFIFLILFYLKLQSYSIRVEAVTENIKEMLVKSFLLKHFALNFLYFCRPKIGTRCEICGRRC